MPWEGASPGRAGEEAKAQHSQLLPHIPEEKPVGRCQFIPEQPRGPAEGAAGAGCSAEDPLAGPRGLMPTHGGVGAQQASRHGLSRAQQCGLTCATGDMPPSQGRCWHPQYHSRCPGLSPLHGLRCAPGAAARLQPPLSPSPHWRSAPL